MSWPSWQAGCSIRTFSEMIAENPMLRASHYNQIYCGLLRIWYIKFKPWMLQETQRKMSVEYKFGCYDVYQNKNNLASSGCMWDIFTLLVRHFFLMLQGLWDQNVACVSPEVGSATKSLGQCWCMIKIFRVAGVVTPPNVCLYPSPALRCFWKDPLMTPTPSPSTTPPPLKILIIHLQNLHRLGLFATCCRYWEYLATSATAFDLCRRIALTMTICQCK